MTKELEAFERTLDIISSRKQDDNLQCYIEIVETALKTLEIIKEKEVDVALLKMSKDKNEYVEFLFRRITEEKEKYKNILGYTIISQKEYDLLKEELE